MKRLLLPMICAALCATAANAQSSKPEICPSVNAIKATQFFIQKETTNRYIATQEDQKYDTNWQDVWHFEIYTITANSVEEAREKLNAALPSLTFKEGPIQMGGMGWDCNYNIDSGLAAQAYGDPTNRLRRSYSH
jgi:hypothetical protein